MQYTDELGSGIPQAGCVVWMQHTDGLGLGILQTGCAVWMHLLDVIPPRMKLSDLPWRICNCKPCQLTNSLTHLQLQALSTY